MEKKIFIAAGLAILIIAIVIVAGYIGVTGATVFLSNAAENRTADIKNEYAAKAMEIDAKLADFIDRSNMINQKYNSEDITQEQAIGMFQQIHLEANHLILEFKNTKEPVGYSEFKNRYSLALHNYEQAKEFYIEFLKTKDGDVYETYVGLYNLFKQEYEAAVSIFDSNTYP